MAEIVKVRSAGKDGIAYTDDDIMEQRQTTTLQGVGVGIKKNIEETAEKGARGAAKGVIQGIKESKSKPKKENEGVNR